MSEDGWDERITIGMVVEVTGHTVKGRGYGNEDTKRIAINYPKGKRVKGIVLGRSYRYAGKVRGAYDDQRYLEVGEAHPVWMVQPLQGKKYRRAIAVLQEQIVLGVDVGRGNGDDKVDSSLNRGGAGSTRETEENNGNGGRCRGGE